MSGDDAGTAVKAVRNEIVTLLDGRGAVMSSVELADALIVAHGCPAASPTRTPSSRVGPELGNHP